MEAFYQIRSCFGVYFLISIALFGVRRRLKMIVSHRAPSSFNMSSYRAIWTHFRPDFIFVGQASSDLGQEIEISLKCHSSHLAILINI